MRIVSLTEYAARELLNSVIMTEEVKQSVVNVISNFGACMVQFIHSVMYLHSKIYVRATEGDPVLNSHDLNRILVAMRAIDSTIEPSQLLIADKMDVLYGTDYRSYCEYSKFSMGFYEEVFNIVTGGSNSEPNEYEEQLYQDTINALEYIMSAIEQHVVFAGVECDIDDMIIICILPRSGVLYFIMM